MDNPPAPPADATLISSVFELTPDGATFMPQVSLTIFYDVQKLPQNIDMDSLSIVVFNDKESRWDSLKSVHSEADFSVSTMVDHFSDFALVGKIAVPPPSPPAPARFIVSDMTVTPVSCEPDEEVVISASVTNAGGSSGGYELVLSVNGVQESTKYFTLGPGASLTVAFALKKTVPDIYQVDLNGIAASFVVGKPIQPPPLTTAPAVTPPPMAQEPPQQFNWLIFGIITGVVVLVGAIYGVIWRKRRGHAAKPG